MSHLKGLYQWEEIVVKQMPCLGYIPNLRRRNADSLSLQGEAEAIGIPPRVRNFLLSKRKMN